MPDYSKQYSSLPSYGIGKRKEDEWAAAHPYIDPYADQLSRADELNQTPMAQPAMRPTTEELLSMSRPQPVEEKQAMMSLPSDGRAPAALPPEAQKAEVAKYLSQKNNPDDYQYYENDARSGIAEELAAKNKMRAGLGQGFQSILKGVSGVDDGGFYKNMDQDANQPIAQENSRQAKMNEYLKNKYEGGIKKDAYNLQLEELRSKNRHEGVMEGLKRDELNASTRNASVKTQSPFGNLSTEDDAKKAKVVATAYDSYTKKLDRLRELREAHGGELYGPVAAEMQSLGASAIVDFKNMAELGALSGGDLSLVNDALGDVTSHMTSDPAVLAKLDAARKNANDQMESFAKGYGGKSSGVITKPPPTKQSMEDAKLKEIDDRIRALDKKR